VHDRLDEESTLEDNDSRWLDDIDARESSLTAEQEDDGEERMERVVRCIEQAVSSTKRSRRSSFRDLTRLGQPVSPYGGRPTFLQTRVSNVFLNTTYSGPLS